MRIDRTVQARQPAVHRGAEGDQTVLRPCRRREDDRVPQNQRHWTSDPTASFPAGLQGMIVNGYWTPGELAKTAPDKNFAYGWVPVPADRKGKKVQATGGHNSGIPKGATKADKAWQFIEYLTTDKAIDIILQRRRLDGREQILPRQGRYLEVQRARLVREVDQRDERSRAAWMWTQSKVSPARRGHEDREKLTFGQAQAGGSGQADAGSVDQRAQGSRNLRLREDGAAGKPGTLAQCSYLREGISIDPAGGMAMAALSQVKTRQSRRSGNRKRNARYR